jgi:hypothetical protein
MTDVLLIFAMLLDCFDHIFLSEEAATRIQGEQGRGHTSFPFEQAFLVNVFVHVVGRVNARAGFLSCVVHDMDHHEQVWKSPCQRLIDLVHSVIARRSLPSNGALAAHGVQNWQTGNTILQKKTCKVIYIYMHNESNTHDRKARRIYKYRKRWAIRHIA